MRLIHILMFAMLIPACSDGKQGYIITSNGLINTPGRVRCVAGMLVSYDSGFNILDKNSNPITCTGKIRLTKDEYKNYGA